MKMKKMGLGLATAVAVTSGMVLGGSPAQAMSLADRPYLNGILSINLGNRIQSIDANFIDFGLDNSDGSVGTTALSASDFTGVSVAGIAPSTGSFSAITSGFIKDLKIGGSFPLVGVTEFLTLTDADGTVTFDIVKLVDQQFNTSGGFQANVIGIFNPTGQGNASSDLFQFKLKASANTGTIELTPIPTPAVLPGLIGMGVAALRKKSKSEEAELAEADA